MKTVVLQSYRTERVEGVVSVAMASVRQWAAARGYAYEFMDDRFFDAVPPAFRDRTQGAIWQMADMARLIHLKRLLETYDRAIWLDADAVVLDLEAFRTPEKAPFFFCREYWVDTADPGAQSEVQIRNRVNNSICGFTRGDPFLDWYAKETERATLAAPQETDWKTTPLSTKILSKTHRQTPFPLYTHCAIMSPTLHGALADPVVAAKVWNAYADAAKGVAAINMTLSMTRGGRFSDGTMLEGLGRLWSLNAARPGWPRRA